MNRGSRDGVAQLLERIRRFNEAPIHESGKCLRRRETVYAGGGRASMRPRFMNRGSSSWVRIGDPSSLRFNEAPIHESGK